jgi:hypothetical protein
MKCFRCGAFFKQEPDKPSCLCNSCLDETGDELTQAGLYLTESDIQQEVELLQMHNGCSKTRPVFYD